MLRPSTIPVPGIPMSKKVDGLLTSTLVPRIGMIVSMHGPSDRSGIPAALRLLQVSGMIWVPKTPQHRRWVDVGQSVLDDRVHDEQERHLEEQRQAAGQRVDPALLEQLLLRQAGLHRVALVAPLDLLDLGLEELHPALRHELAPIQRDEDRPDHERQRDDRPPMAAGTPRPLSAS